VSLFSFKLELVAIQSEKNITGEKSNSLITINKWMIFYCLPLGGLKPPASAGSFEPVFVSFGV